MLQWLEATASGLRQSMASYVLRWQPELDLSRLGWAVPAGVQWPDMVDMSVVDRVGWAFVVAFESLALASMLCFFFVCCGCTL